MSSNLLRAVVIDPIAETFTEVTTSPGKAMAFSRKIIGCQLAEFVYSPGGEHVILVDEEGLVRGDPNKKGFFQPTFYDRPMCGKAVVFGMDRSAEFTSCKIAVHEFQHAISFPKVEFLGFTDAVTQVNHPLFGHVTQFSREAHFKPIGVTVQ